jgi:hypothetical protein
MAETLEIPVSDLLIDVENPRLNQPNVGQRDAQRQLAKHVGSKFLKLAEDIVEFGLSPADLPIVMPNKGDSRYIVVEGNRRLVALKGLENPDSMAGAVTPNILTALRKLSAQYQQNPIESINCAVVKDRDEARHWMLLRHVGGHAGAGIEPWGHEESIRYRARSGAVEPHLQALDFLEKRGDLKPEHRRNVPGTNLKRLLSTPEVREKLGVDIRDKTFIVLGNENQVSKALLHVVNDLASGKTKVEDIYTKDKRIAYANSLPANIIVKPTAKSGQGASDGTGAQPHAKRTATAKLPKLRNKLIPRDCVLTVTDSRIARIEQELRALNFEDYTNAVAVLFRVFVELSVDAYITKHNIQVGERTPLTKKIDDACTHLVTRQKLNKEQARPVRRAAQADSFLAPSTTLLNGYVHSQYIFPAPGDLRAHWDNLQPFFTAIWSA